MKYGDDKSHVGLMVCFYCGEEFGVALDKRLQNSLPLRAIYNMEPCPKCREVLDTGGMILIATTTPGQEIERQRKEAKCKHESRSLLWRKAHPLNFVPDINRIAMVGLSPEGAQKVSGASNGFLKPGECAFISKEVWDTYFADAAREKNEQGQKG